MFRIEVTHLPSSRFGDDRPEALPEPRLFQGFRARTSRNAQTIYGGAAEAVLHDETRHRAGPMTWATRKAAERNVHHLTSRGYTARVVEI